MVTSTCSFPASSFWTLTTSSAVSFIPVFQQRLARLIELTRLDYSGGCEIAVPGQRNAFAIITRPSLRASWFPATTPTSISTTSWDSAETPAMSICFSRVLRSPLTWNRKHRKQFAFQFPHQRHFAVQLFHAGVVQVFFKLGALFHAFHVDFKRDVRFLFQCVGVPFHRAGLNVGRTLSFLAFPTRERQRHQLTVGEPHQYLLVGLFQV
jgi:hypothetical protein